MSTSATSAPSALEHAKQLARLGQSQTAEALCEQILREHADDHEALLLKGVLELQSQRRPEAIMTFRRSVEVDPANALSQALLGDALLESGDPHTALDAYNSALRLDPLLKPALFGRANALLDLGFPNDALKAYGLLESVDPNNPELHFNRGNAQLALGEQAAAVESYDRALRLDGDYSAAYANRAGALAAMNRLEEALASFDAALRLDSSDLQSHFHRAKVRLQLGRPAEALGDVESALSLAPRWDEAMRLRADILLTLGQPIAAAESLHQLLEAHPHTPYARGAMLHARLWSAAWPHPPAGSDELKDLHDAVLRGERADMPFSFFAIADDPQAQLICAQTFAADYMPQTPLPWRSDSHPHERLRVAYVSADFRNHAAARLLAELFERHDRERFEVIGVSLRAEDSSPLGQRIKGSFDRFFDVSCYGDREVVQALRNLEIDVAVDLVGFTDGMRPQIFAQRLAPLQVGYLGFPGTSGAPYMDYVVADAFVIPESSAQHYSEKIIYLPDSFQVCDTKRSVGGSIPTRAQVGLAQDQFVFCCFSNTYKINPEMFDIWMRTLVQVQDSVLWILGSAANDNLRDEAALRGVDPARLIFAGRVGYQEHLNRLPLADLFLDTLPFNAGAVANDALWAGLPVLTCAGRSFAGRMAGSLLRAAGLPELVTDRLDAYEDKALQLARHRGLLEELRERLCDERGRCALFDSRRFTAKLEAGYLEIWQRHQRGEAPQNVRVAD